MQLRGTQPRRAGGGLRRGRGARRVLAREEQLEHPLGGRGSIQSESSIIPTDQSEPSVILTYQSEPSIILTDRLVL